MRASVRGDLHGVNAGPSHSAAHVGRRGGLLLAQPGGMRRPRGESNHLEHAFRILRFRRRGVVSFRRFVILNGRDADALRSSEAALQPLCVTHR
jgi:hypothetical protein